MLSEQIKGEIHRHFYFVAHHIVSGELEEYIREIESVKLCVVNPSMCDNIIEFFQAFQNLKPICEHHMKRWKAEAERIKKGGEN